MIPDRWKTPQSRHRSRRKPPYSILSAPSTISHTPSEAGQGQDHQPIPSPPTTPRSPKTSRCILISFLTEPSSGMIGSRTRADGNEQTHACTLAVLALLDLLLQCPHLLYEIALARPSRRQKPLTTTTNPPSPPPSPAQPNQPSLANPRRTASTPGPQGTWKPLSILSHPVWGIPLRGKGAG